MNRVDFAFQGVAEPSWLPEAERYLVAAMDAAEVDGWDLSVVLCDDAFIRELNREYRGKDESTDVLSFSLGEDAETGEGMRHLPGDVVVSLETLPKNADYFGVSPNDELKRLFMHGILHLKGMDHATNGIDEPMIALQERLLSGFQEVVLL